MQEARPRRLGERTVDYGLAAMDFCGTLTRTAAGRHEAACVRRHRQGLDDAGLRKMVKYTAL